MGRTCATSQTRPSRCRTRSRSRPEMTGARAAPPVAEAVDASREGLFALLRELISFRTESQAKEATHFPEEARRCIDFVSAFLEELGFEIEGWDVGPSATFE